MCIVPDVQGESQRRHTAGSRSLVVGRWSLVVCQNTQVPTTRTNDRFTRCCLPRRFAPLAFPHGTPNRGGRGRPAPQRALGRRRGRADGRHRGRLDHRRPRPRAGLDYFADTAGDRRAALAAATVVDFRAGCESRASDPGRCGRLPAGQPVHLCGGPNRHHAAERGRRRDERDALRRGDDRQPRVQLRRAGAAPRDHGDRDVRAPGGERPGRPGSGCVAPVDDRRARWREDRHRGRDDARIDALGCREPPRGGRDHRRDGPGDRQSRRRRARRARMRSSWSRTPASAANRTTTRSPRAPRTRWCKVAHDVPGIDLIVFGHTHREVADTTINGVLLTQPRNWATSVSLAHLMFEKSGGAWHVAARHASIVRAAGHREQAAVVAAAEHGHASARKYAGTVIGHTTVAWNSDSARLADTPIMDFVAETMRRASGADLASVSAFSTAVKIPAGPVTVAQLAQLYPYENTLRVLRISGEQLKAFLEQSAKYFRVTGSGSEPRVSANPAIPGYNYEIVTGADYTIDLSRQLGERITGLSYRGKPVRENDSFTIALSNYRAEGSGGYAMLRGAPVVYDRQQDIRQLLIDEVTRRGTLNPADYFTRNWSLIRRREPRRGAGHDHPHHLDERFSRRARATARRQLRHARRRRAGRSDDPPRGIGVQRLVRLGLSRRRRRVPGNARVEPRVRPPGHRPVQRARPRGLGHRQPRVRLGRRHAARENPPGALRDARRERAKCNGRQQRPLDPAGHDRRARRREDRDRRHRDDAHAEHHEGVERRGAAVRRSGRDGERACEVAARPRSGSRGGRRARRRILQSRHRLPRRNHRSRPARSRSRWTRS